ncbi:MAG: integrase core domain-containing protein [Alphaproteobacteria bacterium]
MGNEAVVTAPRSPWQNPFVERMVGSISRECLDHPIVIDERHLRRILASYFDYFHRSRTHVSLAKDSPVPRPVESAKAGEVIAIPQVGGLHRRYERLAAWMISG